MTSSAVLSLNSFFNFSHAICRGIPNSLKDEALRMEDNDPVNLEIARKNFEIYKSTLESCGVEVISLEADESYPDCVFVEDTCVVIGNVAFITRPGHPNRRDEVNSIREILKTKFNMTVKEVEDSEAIIDGGDVLFTGQEIFVGLSKRTNGKGIEALTRAFPQFPVVPIHVTGGLHLKSGISLGGENLILIGGKNAQEMAKEMKEKAHGEYTYALMHQDAAANVIFVNGNILHQSAKEIGPQNAQALKETVNCPTFEMSWKEFNKVDGGLTCCSLLVSILPKC